jgi:ABC-type phosphate transport system ATPase subunit
MIRDLSIYTTTLMSLFYNPLRGRSIESLVKDMPYLEDTEIKERLIIVEGPYASGRSTRVSDENAFMYLGELIEYNSTKKIFENPEKEDTESYISGKFR